MAKDTSDQSALAIPSTNTSYIIWVLQLENPRYLSKYLSNARILPNKNQTNFGWFSQSANFFLSGRLVSQTELYVNYNLLWGFKRGPAAKLENQQDSNSWRSQLYLVSISNLGM